MPENAKPTEGPWRIRDEEGPPLVRIWADGRVIAHCIPKQFQRAMGHPTDVILRAYPEAEANARLIVEAVTEYAIYQKALANAFDLGDSSLLIRGPSSQRGIVEDMYRDALNRIIRNSTDQDVAVPIAERAFAAAKALREGEKP